MKNEKNIGIVLLVLAIVAVLAFSWRQAFPQKNNEDTITPTVAATPIVTVTPVSDKRVNEYTSSNAHLAMKFSKPMYVSDTKVSATSGWIVVSMNPPDQNAARENGLSINYETPSIEGKGGACEPSQYHANSVLGQTVYFCESQTSMYLSYLMNKSAKTEYSFFIEAKGVTEYAIYREIITNGLSFK